MAASPCVEKGRMLLDWSARPDSGSGRPFGGSVKAFLESQLKHDEARYLKLKGITYNYFQNVGSRFDLFFKAKMKLKG